jgi:hypothetical protein
MEADRKIDPLRYDRPDKEAVPDEKERRSGDDDDGEERRVTVSVLLEAGKDKIPEKKAEKGESDEYGKGEKEECAFALGYLRRLVGALPIEPLVPENSVLCPRILFAVHIGKRIYLNARDCTIQFRLPGGGRRAYTSRRGRLE